MKTGTKFSWTHLLVTVLTGGVALIAPEIRNLIGAHPYVSTVLFTVWNVLGVFLPKPAGAGAQ
jgi:hypothetical protein